jgi:hypothetical protein
MLSSLRRVTFAFVGCCTALLTAQDDGLPKRPADVGAALAAAPLAAADADGARVELIDAATDEPLAGADLFVVERELLRGRRAAFASMQKEFAGDEAGYHLLLAAWFGRRYRTGADGVAIVPPAAGATLVAVRGDHLGVQVVSRWPEAGITLRLVERVHYEVTVTDSFGRPAAGVPVEWGSLWEHGPEFSMFEAQATATSGTDGRARIAKDRLRPDDNLAAQVAVLLPRPLAARVERDADGRQREPIAFTLPPCGVVRVLVYGPDEQPVSGLESVRLRSPGAESHDRRTGLPSQLDGDSALFRWVGLDQEVEVVAKVAGITGELRAMAAGPTHRGELVVCDVRMAVADPIVRLVARAADGSLLANAKLGLLRGTHDATSLEVVATDGAGRAQFTVASAWLQAAPDRTLLLVARGDEREPTQYRGAFVVMLADEARGLVDLGEVTFAAEPVLAAGVLRDGDGKPLAGVRLRAEATWRHGTRSLSVPGDVETHFEHHVRTDADGRFAIRELAPKDVPIDVRVWRDAMWVLREPTQLAAGETNAKLVAVRSASLAVRLVDGKRLRGHGVGLRRHGDVEPMVEWPSDDTVSWQGLAPGRYVLSVQALGATVDLLDDLEVRAGEACADARLRSVDFGERVRCVTVQVWTPAGQPLRAASVVGVHVQQNSSSAQTHTTDAHGRVEFVFPAQGNRVSIGHPEFRTVSVEEPKGVVQVAMRPRPAVRLVLADGETLPDGLRLVLQVEDVWWWAGSTLPGEATWQHGKDCVVRPECDGPMQLALFGRDGTSLGRHAVTVPIGDAVDVPVPLDAQQLAEVRAAFADGK